MRVPTGNRVIAVFGAYGHTARFVVAELGERGWTPVLSGRDAAKLATVAAGSQPVRERRLASIEDPASLDRAVAGAAAVVNCAGPFGETAPAVIEAALRAGIHYLDVNGQSLVTIRTFDTYADDARVREAGIVIAPALGFYGALGDLLATAAMAGWPSADEISIAVALDSWKPTRGTLLAGENTAGRRVVLRGHRLRILPGDQPPPSGTWDFPAPFGPQEVVGEFSTTDVVTIARHLDVADVQAFINRIPLADLDEPDSSGPQAADNTGVQRSGSWSTSSCTGEASGAAPWRAAATSTRSPHRSWWRRWSGSSTVGARPPAWSRRARSSMPEISCAPSPSSSCRWRPPSGRAGDGAACGWTRCGRCDQPHGPGDRVRVAGGRSSGRGCGTGARTRAWWRAQRGGSAGPPRRCKVQIPVKARGWSG